MNRVDVHSMIGNEVSGIFRNIEAEFHSAVPNLIPETASIWNTVTDYMARQSFIWFAENDDLREWRLYVYCNPQGHLWWKSYAVEVSGEYWFDDEPAFFLKQKLTLHYPFSESEKKTLETAMREIYVAVMSEGGAYN